MKPAEGQIWKTKDGLYTAQIHFLSRAIALLRYDNGHTRQIFPGDIPKNYNYVRG